MIASPLTGLLMAYGVTFAAPPARPAGPPVTLKDAAHVVAATHDLGHVNWIRPRGPAMLARIDVGGEMRVFAVGRDGLTPAERNWPRLIHEGNWKTAVSAPLNIATSVVFVLLIVTGLTIWARRTLRRRGARASVTQRAAA